MLVMSFYTLLSTAMTIPHTQFAAYPVLLPVYLMRYDWKVPTLAEKVPLTCIVQAHSNDVR